MPEGQYQKICKLKSCQRVFYTNRDWQEFCQDRDPDDPKKCYRQYWRENKRGSREIKSQLEELKREISELKEMIPKNSINKQEALGTTDKEKCEVHQK